MKTKDSSLPVRIQRVYDPPTKDDGVRILVDRLWPRGLSKAQAKIDRWMKDIAPSTALRQWFAHDPRKWQGFRRRYRAELAKHVEAGAMLRSICAQGPVTLVYGAQDQTHNQAVVLQEWLAEQAPIRRRKATPAESTTITRSARPAATRATGLSRSRRSGRASSASPST